MTNDQVGHTNISKTEVLISHETFIGVIRSSLIRYHNLFSSSLWFAHPPWRMGSSHHLWSWNLSRHSVHQAINTLSHTTTRACFSRTIDLSNGRTWLGLGVCQAHWLVFNDCLRSFLGVPLCSPNRQGLDKTLDFQIRRWRGGKTRVAWVLGRHMKKQTLSFTTALFAVTSVLLVIVFEFLG